jgi:hypothetical protein
MASSCFGFRKARILAEKFAPPIIAQNIARRPDSFS